MEPPDAAQRAGWPPLPDAAALGRTHDQNAVEQLVAMAVIRHRLEIVLSQGSALRQGVHEVILAGLSAPEDAELVAFGVEEDDEPLATGLADVGAGRTER